MLLMVLMHQEKADTWVFLQVSQLTKLSALHDPTDLYLRLQCADTSCQARVETAQLCCVRNFNLNCCRYRHHTYPVNHNMSVTQFY